MEVLLTDDDDGECVSEPWQRAYHPSCNGMHEFDLLHVDDNVMWSFSKTRLLAKCVEGRSAISQSSKRNGNIDSQESKVSVI